MSEEIIIDGVDVGKCNFLGVKLTKKYMCTCEGIDFCSEEPSCYYKQYKRLEELLPDINGKYYRAVDDLKAKEQECERWQAEFADKASELQHIEETIKPIMKRPDDLDCYDVEWIVVAFVDEFKQLKVENEELKKQVNDLLHKPEIQDKILWKIDNEALLGSKDAWIYKLEKTLAEIKEFIENGMKQDVNTRMILQKISEVLPNEKV